MLEVKEAIEKLETSDMFQDWRKENPDSYLANAFMMGDAWVSPEWHVGYYDKEKDLITTFAVNSHISKSPQSEVFKENRIIPALDREKIKVSVKDALNVASTLQREKYPADQSIKRIVLLQNIDEIHMYNITFITHTFNTINVRVSSEDCRILSHKSTAIADFAKGHL